MELNKLGLMIIIADILSSSPHPYWKWDKKKLTGTVGPYPHWPTIFLAMVLNARVGESSPSWLYSSTPLQGAVLRLI
jgi:hypothetical protein